MIHHIPQRLLTRGTMKAVFVVLLFGAIAGPGVGNGSPRSGPCAAQRRFGRLAGFVWPRRVHPPSALDLRPRAVMAPRPGGYAQEARLRFELARQIQGEGLRSTRLTRHGDAVARLTPACRSKARSSLRPEPRPTSVQISLPWPTFTSTWPCRPYLVTFACCLGAHGHVLANRTLLRPLSGTQPRASAPRRCCVELDHDRRHAGKTRGPRRAIAVVIGQRA